MQIEKQIMTYDLHSYSQELQQAVLDGYRIVDQTIGFPQQIGSTLVATLLKEAQQSTTEAFVGEEAPTQPQAATKPKKVPKNARNEVSGEVSDGN